jgi:hypothetical protein
VAPPPRLTRTTKRIIVACSAGLVLLAVWIAVDQLFMCELHLPQRVG